MKEWKPREINHKKMYAAYEWNHAIDLLEQKVVTWNK